MYEKKIDVSNFKYLCWLPVHSPFHKKKFLDFFSVCKACSCRIKLPVLLLYQKPFITVHTVIFVCNCDQIMTAQLIKAEAVTILRYFQMPSVMLLKNQVFFKKWAVLSISNRGYNIRDYSIVYIQASQAPPPQEKVELV